MVGAAPSQLISRVSTAVLDGARRALAERGWAVIRDLPLDPTGRDHDAVLDIASRFGRPSCRDGGTAVWPVTAREHDRLATFSVRAGEAALHTDAQYRARPEELVCLFVIRRATDGGATRLLSVQDVVTALRQRAGGEWLLARLREPVWRWATPRPFSPEPGFRAAVLLSECAIRWRADNLAGDLCKPTRAAARLFAEFVRTAPGVAQVWLDPRDMVIIDNLRMLHGRTAFTDPRRLLLRVRLWADC